MIKSSVIPLYFHSYNLLYLIFRTTKEKPRERGGQIPYLEIDGFNAGEFFEDYLNCLNPESDLLFTRPQRTAAWFKINSEKTTCYFETGKVGSTHVGKFMPTLSSILGIPRITNNQIRPTSIRKLKRAGFEDRVIMELSGHRQISTLAFYDPAPDNSVKINRSIAILGAVPKKPKPSSTVTSAQAEQTPNLPAQAEETSALTHIRSPNLPAQAEQTSALTHIRTPNLPAQAEEPSTMADRIAMAKKMEDVKRMQELGFTNREIWEICQEENKPKKKEPTTAQIEEAKPSLVDWLPTNAMVQKK